MGTNLNPADLLSKITAAQGKKVTSTGYPTEATPESILIELASENRAILKSVKRKTIGSWLLAITLSINVVLVGYSLYKDWNKKKTEEAMRLWVTYTTESVCSFYESQRIPEFNRIKRKDMGPWLETIFTGAMEGQYDPEMHLANVLQESKGQWCLHAWDNEPDVGIDQITVWVAMENINVIPVESWYFVGRVKTEEQAKKLLLNPVKSAKLTAYMLNKYLNIYHDQWWAVLTVYVNGPSDMSFKKAWRAQDSKLVSEKAQNKLRSVFSYYKKLCEKGFF